MATPYSNLQQSYVGEYIELFDLDLTHAGGPILRFTPNEDPNSQPVTWRGQTYQALPVDLEGFDRQLSGAPPQPVMKASNINKFFMASINSLNDMVGAKLTRWRTFGEFLDNGSNADPNTHYPVETFILAQKQKINPLEVTFKFITYMDRPGLRIPRRQVLRDPTTMAGETYKFPGVSRIGVRIR